MQTKERNRLKDNPVGEGYDYNFKESFDRCMKLSWMCLKCQNRVEGKFTRPTVLICYEVECINKKSIHPARFQPGLPILFLLLRDNIAVVCLLNS